MKIKSSLFAVLLIFIVFVFSAVGQNGGDSDKPKPTKPVRRTSVKIGEIADASKANKSSESVDAPPAAPNTAAAETDPSEEKISPVERAVRNSVVEREVEKRQAVIEEEARIEREKREAELKAEAMRREAELKAESERRESELKAEADEREKALKLAQKEREDQITAEREKNAELARQEAEKREAELREKIAEEKKRSEELAAENRRKLDEETARMEAENQKAAEEARLEAERLELERQAEAKRQNEAFEAERQAKLKLRNDLILQTAARLKFLVPAEAVPLVSESLSSADEIEEALRFALDKNPKLAKRSTFCDPDFVGQNYTDDTPSDITLGSLLNTLRYYYNVNFLPDSEVLSLPVRINVENVPWNVVLRSQLSYLDLTAQCVGPNTISILKRSKVQLIEQAERQSAPLQTEFIKLRYLQPTSGGTVDVAGRGSGGSNAFETLESTINRILRAGGDTRGTIARIPGKAEFIITATEEQITQIKAVIARADRPAYQVIVYGLIYTANQNKIKDIGGQVSIIGGTGDLGVLGGLGNLGGASGGGSAASGGVNPGGVGSLGTGFTTPSQGNSIFGFSAILGTNQFSAQISLLQQKGLVKIENRPMILVEDGGTGLLKIGRQVAVPILQNGVAGSSNSGLEILNAANTLQVTPQVVEDENGNPIAIKLNTRIESNEVDTSVISQGIPSVQLRSAQSNFQINLGDTVVLGDFTTDAETDSETKTPGLGDIPVIGGLFKRKVKSVQKDRLFFAIRAEVVPVGTVINTVPLKLETEPRIPESEYFSPNNVPQVPVTKTQLPAQSVPVETTKP